ncbi:hypothetical protein KFK09_004123 [Dendrobium nobile]|uniref:Rab3-GAP regulatory subunit N-terminal domain-containing protein n=1 Tax=Dendrobium nobile TaxID=94219 RepID=A0A8T3BZP5_DENNO|nr:hypothetical protein KFK09_004123 [Dendrobium nobile]
MHGRSSWASGLPGTSTSGWRRPVGVVGCRGGDRRLSTISFPKSSFLFACDSLPVSILRVSVCVCVGDRHLNALFHLDAGRRLLSVYKDVTDPVAWCCTIAARGIAHSPYFTEMFRSPNFHHDHITAPLVDRSLYTLELLCCLSHFTDLCCIACSELEDLGAGEREGWLSDSSLLSALHPHALALAHTSLSLLLFLPLDPSSSRRPTTVRPSLSAEEGRISAIEWLPFADLLALALGTSSGSLLIYSLSGIVHPGRILRLRFREKRGESLLDATGSAASSEELCVVLSRAVARFDGSDIQSLFRRWLEEEGSQMWNNRLASEDDDDSPYQRIPFQLWNVSKYGSCVDAAIVRIMPPPLLELQSSQRYYCAIAVGEDAVISAFRLSEDRSRSIVGTILSKVVPATFSTLASVSRMIWRSEQKPLKKPHMASQPFAKASPLTCLKDSPRKGEKLAVSPSGTLAAITDSLGRILLLDTQALVVVRLWKGYREASCLFMEAMIDKDKASTSSNYPGLRKNDYYLCLAIHAPRKGIIEIWKMRTGTRLLTVQCPKGSIILQPPTRSVASSSSTYNPLEVFLLNGDSGQLSVLNRSIS